MRSNHWPATGNGSEAGTGPSIAAEGSCGHDAEWHWCQIASCKALYQPVIKQIRIIQLTVSSNVLEAIVYNYIHRKKT